MPLRTFYIIGARVFADAASNTNEDYDASKTGRHILQLTWPGVGAYVFHLEQVCP